MRSRHIFFKWMFIHKMQFQKSETVLLIWLYSVQIITVLKCRVAGNIPLSFWLLEIVFKEVGHSFEDPNVSVLDRDWQMVWEKCDRSHLGPVGTTLLKHQAYNTNYQLLLRQPWTPSPDDLTLIRVAAQTSLTNSHSGWDGGDIPQVSR